MTARTFSFDRNSFRIENVGLKALSKATIDPRITFVNEKGETVRMSIPTSIARLVRNQLHGVTKFSTPYPAALAFVDGRIVSMAVALGKDLKMFEEFGEWISVLERREVMVNQLMGNDWLWDGQYAYKFVGEVIPLGESGFGSIATRAFNMFKLGEDKTDPIEPLAALCYKHPTTGEWVKTSPITRHSGGFIQITGDVGAFNAGDQFVDSEKEFAKIDTSLFVNLRFVNYGARVLSQRFGYEAIEPLGLPLLMIEHRTFNVGGLALPVQMSSPAPLKFTRAMAWMIGLFLQVKDLDDMIAVKQTFKMLLTKGNTNQRMMGEDAKTEVPTKTVIATLRAKMESAALIDFDA